jgi:uncharacterized membrane protein
MAGLGESEEYEMTKKQMMARALGAFSVGLGTVQLVAPRRFAQAIGIQPNQRRERLVRFVGAREYAVVPGLMTRERPLAWTWARVAGDTMDIALLARAMRAHGVQRDRVTAAFGAVAGVTALDLAAAVLMARPREAGAGLQKAITTGTLEVRKSITIARPREELYRFWRDFRNLPQFMANVESIEVTGDRSHWTVKAPITGTVSWDAEIVEDRPGELISWRTLDGAVRNGGTVRFATAPGDRGTEIHVHMEYSPPLGIVGAAVARISGQDAEQQTREDLRRFKQIMETGEIVRSEAVLSGSSAKQRPGQPPEDAEPAPTRDATRASGIAISSNDDGFAADGSSPIPVTTSTPA